MTTLDRLRHILTLYASIERKTPRIQAAFDFIWIALWIAATESAPITDWRVRHAQLEYKLSRMSDEEFFQRYAVYEIKS